ncbi:hypothetical protein RchiOBHm_Chr5g0065021 [Rosa chinensis]|uniref:Uncharacterized protein n=1 Tax=Rosa chinensis TaxID=74649 RepID=A0A2P6QIV2_ROSCH|nr:hypothetical protein RchiOBHm_Chr5g0065021 [Rosa chinensis]
MFRKKRLDELCLERYEQYSRTYIQSWILHGGVGKVVVDTKVVNKADTPNLINLLSRLWLKSPNIYNRTQVRSCH